MPPILPAGFNAGSYSQLARFPPSFPFHEGDVYEALKQGVSLLSEEAKCNSSSCCLSAHKRSGGNGLFNRRAILVITLLWGAGGGGKSKR